jgi:hypothetical protein
MMNDTRLEFFGKVSARSTRVGILECAHCW